MSGRAQTEGSAQTKQKEVSDLKRGPKPPPEIDSFLQDVDLILYRSTPKPKRALDIHKLAASDGRGHRVGESVPLYAGCSEAVAIAEFRFWSPALIGCKIRNTVLTGRVLLLDAKDKDVADAFETTPSDLADPDDPTACQQLARDAFALGAQALRIKSAREPKGDIVIVEHSAALALLREDKVVEQILE